MQPESEKQRVDEIGPEVEGMGDETERAVREYDVTPEDQVTARGFVHPDNPRGIETNPDLAATIRKRE
jgi:hypothetical protein